MVNTAILGQGDLASYIIKKLDEDDIAQIKGIITHESVGIDCIPREENKVLEVESINKDKYKKNIDGLDIDVLFCAGWYEIIDEDILNIPPYGVIGIHASPLPKGRGGAPVNWQMIYGMQDVTLSAFRFTERVDDGPILSQSSVPIETRDDIRSLYNKVIINSGEVILDIVSDIHNEEVSFTEQLEEEATYWPQRTPEDGLLDWNLSSSFLSRFILAQTDPYPGAFTYLDRKKISIIDVDQIEHNSRDSKFEPGEVTNIVPGQGITVMTGDGPIKITKLSYDGGPNQWADRWARRHGVETGQGMGHAEDFPEDFSYTGLRGPDGRRDFHLTTNVEIGSEVENNAVIYSPHKTREITVSVLKDGEKMTSRTKSERGWVYFPIRFTLSNPGESYIQVLFSDEESKMDERRFYVYSRN